MENIDRLGWAAGISLLAYGLRLGIRVNVPSLLERLFDRLPPGWEPSSETAVAGLYSVVGAANRSRKGMRRYNLVYAGATRLARTINLDEALDQLESHMQLIVAATSSEKLFVHAGVVGWQGRAIILPGRSFSGKTTLVTALLKAGATYYSDEYAIFDRQGRVWPYARPLSIREQGQKVRRRCLPEEMGGSSGQTPLPVGLVVVTEYLPDAHWQAYPLSPGQALLALLNNTVAARSQAEQALTTLRQVVGQAQSITGKRGEADRMISTLFEYLKTSSKNTGCEAG